MKYIFILITIQIVFNSCNSEKNKENSNKTNNSSIDNFSFEILEMYEIKEKHISSIDNGLYLLLNVINLGNTERKLVFENNISIPSSESIKLKVKNDKTEKRVFSNELYPVVIKKRDTLSLEVAICYFDAEFPNDCDWKDWKDATMTLIWKGDTLTYNLDNVPIKR